MKHRKALFTAVLAPVLALGIVAGSAAAVSATEPDRAPERDAADCCDACPAEESYGESIRGMRSLTEAEKAALLADLAEIESLEARILTAMRSCGTVSMPSMMKGLRQTSRI